MPARPALPTPSEAPAIVLRSERLILLLAPPHLASQHLRFAKDNREHLAPWEPPYAKDYYTLGFWKRRLQKNLDEWKANESLRLSIYWKHDCRPLRGQENDENAVSVPLRGKSVLGNCNFGNFVWGAFRCATLGYRLDHRVVGQGVMSEALRCAIQYLWNERKFHRIQANYRPINERSGHVLRRLGFVVEGYARDYLFIDGAWRDHVLTSLTNPNLNDLPG